MTIFWGEFDNEKEKGKREKENVSLTPSLFMICQLQGCGGSKDGVRVAPKGAVAVRIGTKPVVSSQQNDMSVEGECVQRIYGLSLLLVIGMCARQHAFHSRGTLLPTQEDTDGV